MHPSTYYIKFLLARSHGTDEPEDWDSVKDHLSQLGLPRLWEPAFDLANGVFAPPIPFRFNAKTHKSTVAFMRDEKIYTMWKKDKETKAALRILERPAMREVIQVLIMGGIEADIVRNRIIERFQETLSAKSIDVYRHYFWNTDLTTMQEWTAILRGDPMSDHYIAARGGSQQQALFRAGFNPLIEPKAALREAFRSLAMRVEATRNLPDTKETNNMLCALTKEMTALYQVLKADGEGVGDVAKGLKKFKIALDETPAASILQLAGKGNYSRSGANE